MKIKRALLMVAAVTCIFTACKDKEDDEKLSGDNIVVSDPKTPEDHKQNLQESGVALTEDMTALSNESAMDVMSVLSNRMGSLASKKIPLQQKLAALGNYKTNEDGFNTLLSTFKTYSDVLSLKTEWSNIVGTYSYNSTTQRFGAKTQSSNLELDFPSTETGTSNNAKLIIYEPTWYNTSNITYLNSEDLQDLPSEIPSVIKVELVVDSKTIMTYDFALTFNGSGYMTNFLTKLTVGEFALAFEMKNDPSKSVSEELSFKRSSKILVAITAAASGNFTEENINTNGENNPEKIIYTVSSSVQVENIKMTGNVDAKSLIPQANELDAKGLDGNSKDYCDQLVAIINKYASLKVVYADNNQLIASAVATTEKNVDDYDTYYDVELYFQFSDGSPVDPEAYFENGWDKLINAYSKMIQDVSAKYDSQTK
jgi:hypothetical protein